MSDKKRSANFSLKEENILMHFVKKYVKIIENKKTDSNINKLKSEIWKKIEIEFNNASGENRREAMALRKKYENIKKNTKKKIADNKCYNRGTGGGPPKEENFTEVDRDIEEILGERAHEHESEFGGDAYQEEVITLIPAQHSTAEEDTREDSNFQQDILGGVPFTEENVEPSCSWDVSMEQEFNELPLLYEKKGSSGIADQKTPASTPGKRRKISKDAEYNNLFSRVSQWTIAKSALEVEKCKFVQEEHDLKMKLMQQKNETEIAALNREADSRVKQIESEMQAQLEVIRDQNKIKKDILLLEKQKILKEISSLK